MDSVVVVAVDQAVMKILDLIEVLVAVAVAVVLVCLQEKVVLAVVENLVVVLVVMVQYLLAVNKVVVNMFSKMKDADGDSMGVDSSLIGGMVAQVGDISYDASVKARLEDIQSALIRNPGAAAEA